MEKQQFAGKIQPHRNFNHQSCKKEKNLESGRQAAAFGLGLGSVAGGIACGVRLPLSGWRRPVGARHLVGQSVRQSVRQVVEAQLEPPVPNLTPAATAATAPRPCQGQPPNTAHFRRPRSPRCAPSAQAQPIQHRLHQEEGAAPDPGGMLRWAQPWPGSGESACTNTLVKSRPSRPEGHWRGPAAP